MTTLSRDPMLQLIDRIYDAALKPEAWPDVVESIAMHMGNSKGKLFTPLLPVDKGGLGVTIGIPEAADHVWGTQYRDHDVWVIAGVGKGLMWEGNVVPGRSVRATARLATVLAVSFDDTCRALAADGGRCFVTGTPIRDVGAIDPTAACAAAVWLGRCPAT